MTTGLRSFTQLLRRAICAVSGHQTLLQFERNRLSLRCAACGHETKGWTIGDIPMRADAAAASAPRRAEARDAA
jgi:hypothetical protein